MQSISSAKEPYVTDPKPKIYSKVAIVEIRFIGRGGQGVVSAAQLIADASILEDKYVQAFPEFGAERSGAPISAFSLISEEPIDVHCLVTNPTIIVAIDRTLAQIKSSATGLRQGGIYLCNYVGPLNQLFEKLELPKGAKLFSLRATEISLNLLGKDFPNTPMLGALTKVSGLVGIESVEKVLAVKFRGKVLEANLEALRKGYEEVVEY
jgi:2-oxoacid:acceptor oxidoreductase gamma subunit (pyruvate/2-ketoisovalerate family)